MEQVTTISFFKYSGISNQLWAFTMMQFAHSHMSKAPGLQFYKLMGTGKGNGFNPYPDWSTYSLLAVWDSNTHARTFIDKSLLFKKYNSRSSTNGTLFLKPIKVHGQWSGVQPFEVNDTALSSSDEICALTRATIKKRYLRKFWKYVPTSSKPLTDNPNLLFTKGIGEVPVINMATFSIWKNEESLKEFAYKSKEHNKAIQMTRELGWYKEELFSRFHISESQGTFFNHILS